MGEQVTVLFSLNAIADLQAARDRYDEFGVDVAEPFAAALNQTVERLQMFPRSGTPVEGFEDVRRARLRGFPYGLFYRLAETDEVRIVRVLHSRRDGSTE